MNKKYKSATQPLLNSIPSPCSIKILSYSNCADSMDYAVSIGTELYNSYLDSLKNAFETEYRNKCLQAWRLEHFTVQHLSNEYHYTLYYYDQAGNLVKTVPPAGVNKVLRTGFMDSVSAERRKGEAGLVVVPAHQLVTQYRYNTLNQVTTQNTPDAHSSAMWYDRLGRLVLSQNSRQKLAGRLYSYTVYDTLGRITEVGELRGPSTMQTYTARNQVRLNEWLDSAADSRTQITQTVYDEQYTPVNPALDAKNLRSRVSYTRYFTIADSAESGGHQSATYYSYDVHGNVDSLLLDYRDIAGMNRNNRFKKIVYRYDLISGKVNEVTYQPGQPDAFHHRYYYDAENRLTEVHTSKDSLNWEQDASYTYYKHGPLARVLLGNQSVQGVDYAYTLQGWLKGVNTTAVATSPNPSEGGGHTPFDMGVDSMPVAKDAYGFALYYYGQNDYKPIGGMRPFANADTGIVGFKPLYNGNIAAMAVNIPKVGEPLLYKYSYDQLNRITGMDAYRGLNVVSNTWTPISTTSFKERVSYDANGNILAYLRNGNNLIGKPLAMDSMSYHYIAGTNQLDYISDPVNKNNYKEDIDNQEIHNYVYDSIGNLIKDNAEKIQSIDWTVYGKISRILKKDTTEISYIYDAGGQRIAKAVKKNNITAATFYVRDASGNVMSVYEKNDTIQNGHVIQKELHLYGSSRLGMLIVDIDMDSIVPLTATAYFMRGKKRYELTDHRGNVMVVISDVKKPIRSTIDTNLVIGYEPVVISATDYYPFGMQMPGRHGFATETGAWHGSYAFSIPPHLFVDHRAGNTPLEYVASQTIELSNGFLTGAGSDNYVAYIADSASMATLDSAYQLVGNGYRYGFNGKEKDNEIYGDGNELDFGSRGYDPRRGQWLSLDPLRANYQSWSAYNFTMDNPVLFIDPDGKVVTIKDVDSYKAVLGTLTAKEINRISIKHDGTLAITGKGLGSTNLQNLRTLVNSKINNNFITSNTYTSANGKVTLPENVYGRTLFPESESPGTSKTLVSPDNDVYVILKPNTEEGIVPVVAHEGFGHALLGEKKRTGEKVNPEHDYGPEGERNEDFKKQGWKAVGEAKENYKNNLKDKEWKKVLEKKIKEFKTKNDKK